MFILDLYKTTAQFSVPLRLDSNNLLESRRKVNVSSDHLYIGRFFSASVGAWVSKNLSKDTSDTS